MLALWPKLSEQDRRSLSALCNQLEGRWRQDSTLPIVEVGQRDGLISQREAAAFLGIKPDRLYRLEKQHGQVQGRETISGSVHYPATELWAWLKSVAPRLVESPGRAVPPPGSPSGVRPVSPSEPSP